MENLAKLNWPFIWTVWLPSTGLFAFVLWRAVRKVRQGEAIMREINGRVRIHAEDIARYRQASRQASHWRGYGGLAFAYLFVNLFALVAAYFTVAK